MTRVPEKADLFLLNAEVWCDCGLGAEEQEGRRAGLQGGAAGATGFGRVC